MSKFMSPVLVTVSVLTNQETSEVLRIIVVQHHRYLVIKIHKTIAAYILCLKKVHFVSAFITTSLILVTALSSAECRCPRHQWA